MCIVRTVVVVHCTAAWGLSVTTVPVGDVAKKLPVAIVVAPVVGKNVHIV